MNDKKMKLADYRAKQNVLFHLIDELAELTFRYQEAIDRIEIELDGE